jgi:hypothetical protein
MNILPTVGLGAIVLMVADGCGGTAVSGPASSASDGGDNTSSTNSAIVCTSGQTWTRGDRGSSVMHPGGACISCHETSGGPRLTIAGTVYPTAHEPDDCDGVSGSLQVVITDANGRTLTLSVNAAGNFYSTSSVAFPFHAKVVSGGAERAMTAAQTSGDCNSCHTVAGANSAPGRIMAP